MSHNAYRDIDKQTLHNANSDRQMSHNVYPDTDKRHIMFIKTSSNKRHIMLIQTQTNVQTNAT